MSTRFLIDERPLIVLPKLAQVIGLNEAIVLQQVHYWIQGKREEQATQYVFEGRYWVYNTLPEWQKQFPFWGSNTVQRVFRSLEEPWRPSRGERRPDRGPLLLSGLWNRRFKNDPFDRTKWYAIDYEELTRLEQAHFPMTPDWGIATPQSCHMDDPRMGSTKTESTTPESTASESVRGRSALGRTRTSAPKKERETGDGKTIITCREKNGRTGISLQLNLTEPLAYYYGRAPSPGDLRQARRLAYNAWDMGGYAVTQADFTEVAVRARAYWEEKRPGVPVRGLVVFQTAFADVIGKRLKVAA